MDAYTLHYEVPADSAYEAIIKASELLRTGVRVEKVVRVGPTVPGWYECVIDVSEGSELMPESADPVTAAKALHDRDGWPS